MVKWYDRIGNRIEMKLLEKLQKAEQALGQARPPVSAKKGERKA